MSFTFPDRKATSPLEAIKLMCIDCMGGLKNEVKYCPTKKCAVWEFRLGKNPYRKSRELTEEEKEQMKERMMKAREAKEKEKT